MTKPEWRGWPGHLGRAIGAYLNADEDRAEMRQRLSDAYDEWVDAGRPDHDLKSWAAALGAVPQAPDGDLGPPDPAAWPSDRTRTLDGRWVATTPAVPSAPPPPEGDAGLAKAFTRRWVCGVGRSGYHNGANCSPDDPHLNGWGCSYRWEASLSEYAWAAAGGGCDPTPTDEYERGYVEGRRSMAELVRHVAAREFDEAGEET